MIRRIRALQCPSGARFHNAFGMNIFIDVYYRCRVQRKKASTIEPSATRQLSVSKIKKHRRHAEIYADNGLEASATLICRMINLC